MIEANNPDYFYFSEQVIYENKLPALPPNPSPSQSSIITVTTNASSIGTESIYNEEDDTNKDLSPDSAAFILAQIERQNVLLEKDPKSICIQSNKLKAHFTTMQQLVKDNLEEEDEEGFWESVIQNSDQVASRLPHLLSLKLRSGIPSRARGLMWQVMSKSSSLNLETVYEQLCKEKSPHERIIKRDLSRTFPHIDMFKQENGYGQTAMKRILEAYSLYDTDVGYCQGLAFLVGPLLLNMPETQSFCVFVRLMETYEMRSMFTLNMEGLQLRLFQFSHILKEVLPNLSNYLDQHGIHSAMYASQWFLTLFAYVFPMELIHRIYDIVFAEGATETIMRVAIAMLKRSEQEILSNTSEFEDTLDFLTSRKLCEPYIDSFNTVIHDAMALSKTITKSKLEKLAGQYNNVGAPVRFGFWRKKRQANNMRRSASIGSAAPTPPKPPALKKRWSSVSSVPRDWPNSQDSIRKELAELKRVHQKTLEELAEVQCDKQDLECERGALKLTIAELERCRKDELIPARSFSDLNVAECMPSRASPNVEQSNIKIEMERKEQENEMLKLQNEQLQAELEKLKHMFINAFESNKCSQTGISIQRRNSIPVNMSVYCIEPKEIKNSSIKKKKSFYGRVMDALGKSSTMTDLCV